MKLNIYYTLFVILVLLIGCQQTYTKETNQVAVSEPIVKEEKTDISKDIVKRIAPMPKINGVDKEISENIYTGIIIAAMNRNYQIRVEDNLAPLRFTDESGQFKVLDKVKFKIKDGQVYDVTLFEREEYTSKFKNMSKDYSGDDVVVEGTAVILGVDYGRYSAIDDITRKRFLINIPELNLFVGDKIKYNMDRNGRVVNVEKLMS